MEESGELWGKTPRYGGVPTAQAYKGPLPAGERGVEFTTDVPPAKSGHSRNVDWHEGSKGVISKETHKGDFATIPIRVIKNTQNR